MKNLKATILGNAQHVAGQSKIKTSSSDLRNQNYLPANNISRINDS